MQRRSHRPPKQHEPRILLLDFAPRGSASADFEDHLHHSTELHTPGRESYGGILRSETRAELSSMMEWIRISSLLPAVYITVTSDPTSTDAKVSSRAGKRLCDCPPSRHPCLWGFRLRRGRPCDRWSLYWNLRVGVCGRSRCHLRSARQSCLCTAAAETPRKDLTRGRL